MAELTKRQRKRERKRRRMRFEKSPPPARQPPAALAPPPQSTAEKRQLANSPDRQTAAGAGAGAVPQPEQERVTALSAPAPSQVPASAGARYFRGRRHLPLLGLPHWGKQTELDARCANPPLPLARAPATLPAPRTDPAPSRRLARLASTSPPFALVLRRRINVALLPQPRSRAARRGGAAVARLVHLTRVEGGAVRRCGGGGAARVGLKSCARG